MLPGLTKIVNVSFAAVLFVCVFVRYAIKVLRDVTVRFSNENLQQMQNRKGAYSI